jgi:hypothetical protein
MEETMKLTILLRIIAFIAFFTPTWLRVTDVVAYEPSLLVYCLSIGFAIAMALLAKVIDEKNKKQPINQGN